MTISAGSQRTLPVTSVSAFPDGRLDLLDWEQPVQPGGFTVETVYSGVSAGTELTFVRGDHPLYHRTWDRQLGLFVGQAPSQVFPMRGIGYMEVARVVESEVPAAREGDLVCMAYGHRTRYAAGADEFFFPLPADVDPVSGVYIAQLGPIAANGLLHAAAVRCGPNVDDLGAGVAGRRVVVLGAGTVGLFVAAFARAYGAAEVLVIDRDASRRATARRLGAATFDDASEDPGEYCKRRWHWGFGDAGADVAFQTRPSGRSLANALRTLRRQGAVIDLAFYTGGAAEVQLGAEFHHNNLAVVCAQIGRVPRGTVPEWTRYRLAEATVDLLRRQAVLRDICVTSVVPFRDAPRVLRELAAGPGRELTVVLSFGDGASTG